MWFNPKPNIALLCVSTNDQMIQSNVVTPYITITSENQIEGSFKICRLEMGFLSTTLNNPYPVKYCIYGFGDSVGISYRYTQSKKS